VIRLNWAAVVGANRYEVWRNTIDDVTSATALTTNHTGPRVFHDDTAAFDTLYFYWVRAANQAGVGAFSEVASARQVAKLWELSAVSIRAGVALDRQGNVYVGLETTSPASPSRPVHYATKVSPEGAVLWQVELPGPVAYPPTVTPAGDVCFVSGSPRTMLTLIGPDGAVRWQLEAPPPAGAASRARVVGPAVAAGDGTIYYLSEASLVGVSPDGAVLFQSGCGLVENGMAPVIAPDGTIVVASGVGLYAFYLTGPLRWYETRSAATHFAPAIGIDGQIYVGRYLERLVTYRTDGALESNWLGVQALQQPVIAADGTLFVTGPRLAIYGPDQAKRWELRWGSLMSFPPCLSADGLAYWFVADDYDGRNSRLLALRRDGSTACEYPLVSPLSGPPVLRDDGVLLFTTVAGKLQAYRVSAGPEAEAPWPMARGDAQGSSNRSGPPPLPSPPADLAVTPFLGKLRVSWRPSFQWETNEVWRATNPEFTDAVLIEAVPPITLPPPRPGPGGQAHSPVARDFADDLSAEPGKQYFYRVRARSRAGIGPFSHTLRAALPQEVSLLWRFDAPEAISWSTPTLGFDGTVFVRTFRSRVIAVAPDGTQRWERDLQIEGRGPVVVGHNANLYLSTQRGLRVLNSAGEEVANVEAERNFGGPPAIGEDGTLYVVDGATSLAAYSPEGTLRWRKDLGGPAGTGPVVASDGSLRLMVGRDLLALGPDGIDRWQIALPQGLSSGGLALTAEGLVLARSSDGVLRGIGVDGTERWSIASPEPKFASPAVSAEGVVLCVLAEPSAPLTWAIPATGVRRRLTALRGDGGEVWSLPLAVSQLPPPGVAVAADGTVYVHAAGNLLAVDHRGQVRWAFDTEGAVSLTEPILGSDGRLFFAAGNTLFALQTSSGAAAAAWAMVAGDARGTASLRRPVPPSLQAVRSASGIRLQSAAAVLTGFSLLESEDLQHWRIRAQGLPAGEPFTLDIDPSPGQHRFYRPALP
jgi:outer membrane protein assembly factor BamB